MTADAGVNKGLHVPSSCCENFVCAGFRETLPSRCCLLSSLFKRRTNSSPLVLIFNNAQLTQNQIECVIILPILDCQLSSKTVFGSGSKL